MYTFELPRQFFNFVERHNNCEDIFFSGMVAEFLAKNGYNQPCCIWVEGHSKHLEKIARHLLCPSGLILGTSGFQMSLSGLLLDSYCVILDFYWVLVEF